MITIQQQPGLWSPIYNPMVFILDSTNTAQSNFKYIADIYVSGVTDYVRLAVDADPTYNQGMIDIHRIVESYVSSNAGLKALNGFEKASSSMIAYEVKFGEQYGVASAVTTYPMLTVTGTMFAFNAAYTTHDWLDFDGASISIEDTGGMLTDQPMIRTTTAIGNEDNYIHYITNTSGTVYFAEINTYDSASSLIGTYRIENAYQAVASYDERRMIFYSGVRALNAATLYSGVQPVIWAKVYYYTIDLINYDGQSHNQITYMIADNCLNDRVALSLHWKNYKGGFDTYQFDRINIYKTETTRKYYEKKLGSMTNNAWAYVESDGGKVAMDTKVQARYELQSDWTSLTDSLFLMGLIESPEVYFDDGGGFTRVTVISPTTAEYKSYKLGDVEFSTLKVIVEFSNDYWKQRG